jgi:hypothetical protein
VEEESTGQSRLFVILAVSLIGLLVLGLLGVGGVFIIRQNLQEQADASRPTATLNIVLPNPTATFTPLPPLSTNTPAPTPTNTPVVAAGSTGGEEAASSGAGEQGAAPTVKPSPTRTPVSGATTAGTTEVVPETGLGGLEAILIAGGLTIVLLVARRLRTAS